MREQIRAMVTDYLAELPPETRSRLSAGALAFLVDRMEERAEEEEQLVREELELHPEVTYEETVQYESQVRSRVREVIQAELQEALDGLAAAR